MPNKFQNTNLVIKNGVFLLLRMLLVLFLGFFATRLTLQVLGDEKFGIYNIVGGIIAIFAIVSMPIRDSLQRYFNVEHASGKYSPNVVFSTSVRIVKWMILAIIVLYETIGLYLINFVIKYPEEERLTVNIIFQLTALTSILGFLSQPYLSLLFSRENMGIPAFCEIAAAVVKIILLYLIVFIPTDILIPYAGIFLLINVVFYVFYRCYCHRHYSECFVKGCCTDLTLQKNMLNFSGWSFVEAVAGIALTYVSNVFVNVFGGVLYNTAYGISKQIQNAVVSFTTNVLKASEPQITSSTATRNVEYRDQLLMTTVKVCFLAMCFIYIVFHFDGAWLINFWLGKIPLYVIAFCDIMLLSVVLSSISLPFRTLIMATGEIKHYFLTYGVVSAVAMLLMYVLLKMGHPVITVMYLILASNFSMLVVAIFFARREAGIKVEYVLRNIIPAFLVSAVTGAIYCFLRQHTRESFSGILAAGVVCFIIMCLLSYFIALNASERMKIKYIAEAMMVRIRKRRED